MAGKRGNGEGTLRKRLILDKVSGEVLDERWEARVTLPGGKQRSFYGKTREDARRKLTAALRARDTGSLVGLDERQTVRQYLTIWLETLRAAVRPRTHARYAQAIRTHIVPALGSIRLTKLSAQHLQRFYAEKLASGLAPATVAHLHAIMHRALDAAARLDLVTRNVADLVTPPRAARHEMHFLTVEQAQALLTGVRGDRLEALYILALVIGARQGELLALRWQDVDLDAGTLRIEHTLHFERAGMWRLAAPKTERSRRLIEVPSRAVEALRTHRTRQLAERLQMGEAWGQYDFVFTNVIGDPLRGTHLLERHFLPLLEHLELPRIRWHDLRHTCVSLAVRQGVPVPTISQMLGHSTPSMTYDVYAHVLPGMQKAATQAIQEALFGGSGSALG